MRQFITTLALTALLLAQDSQAVISSSAKSKNTKNSSLKKGPKKTQLDMLEAPKEVNVTVEGKMMSVDGSRYDHTRNSDGTFRSSFCLHVIFDIRLLDISQVTVSSL